MKHRRHREERPLDPTGVLLDFLLALRRFIGNYGPRNPPPEFDVTGRGSEGRITVLRLRREMRRHGMNPGPLRRS